jgi:acyl-CoA hydrolase
VRGLASSGQLDCVPISLEEVPELLTSGRLPIDVALLQVSDALVNVDVPVAEYLHPETGEIAERVARYIASVIDDGSTLQIGLGRVPTEALRHLTDRRDLGIHSDVITDGVVDLVEAGVVTGRRKTRHRDRIIASYAWGRGGSTTS